jgi:hypothetical protein
MVMTKQRQILMPACDNVRQRNTNEKLPHAQTLCEDNKACNTTTKPCQNTSNMWHFCSDKHAQILRFFQSSSRAQNQMKWLRRGIQHVNRSSYLIQSMTVCYIGHICIKQAVTAAGQWRKQLLVRMGAFMVFS